MRFLRFVSGQRSGIALVESDLAIDLATVASDLPTDLEGIIAGGPAQGARSASLVAGGAGTRRPISEFTPDIPISNPGKIVCLGLNYADHAKEGGYEIPSYPALFLRVRESVMSAAEPIVRPQCSVRLDYEAELMVIIGKGGKHISEASALEHVFGYTIFNDVSVRDYQRKTHQWTPGKNFDATGPIGPIVVTADELPAGASGLSISARLNGAVMQNGNTADMLFPVAKTIEVISEFSTLHPGDMIAMGTPPGVGHARTPPVFMKDGDIIEIEIERIGTLRSRVVDERRDALTEGEKVAVAS